jgi:hypothetical protein
VPGLEHVPKVSCCRKALPHPPSAQHALEKHG